MTAPKKAPKAQTPFDEGEVDWGGILSSLSSSSMFFRPKEGRTRAKLVLPEGEEPRNFFREVTTSYSGKQKTRYMMLAVLFDGEGVSPQMASMVTPIVVAKTVLKGVVSLLVEGYELFGDKGHGITIIRTGQGLNTDYSVMPSKKVIPVPDDLVWPEEEFDLIAENFTIGSLEFDAQRSNQTIEKTSSKASGNILEDF